MNRTACHPEHDGTGIAVIPTEGVVGLVIGYSNWLLVVPVVTE
jgi:hypothetical protein